MDVLLLDVLVLHGTVGHAVVIVIVVGSMMVIVMTSIINMHLIHLIMRALGTSEPSLVQSLHAVSRPRRLLVHSLTAAAGV